MIHKQLLIKEYVQLQHSAREIAEKLGCSENKVHYWLEKHSIKKRTIRDAVYVRANPNGNPFSYSEPASKQDWFLFGLGLGLYWGEGNKANTHAVRLGNSDPDLINMFLKFLTEIYNIDKTRLRFGLQIFSDCSAREAQKYWCQKLSVDQSHGVLTVYFSNIKLRDIIVTAIDSLRKT